MKKALILIGSPKYKRSSSHSLASYLGKQLTANQIECEYLHVLSNYANLSIVIEHLLKSDLLILSTPLYVDAIPGHITTLLERLYSQKERLAGVSISTMMIINSGFPECSQNDVASEIFKNWSIMCGFECKGSLQIGMGGALNGVPLEKLPFTRKLRQSIDKVAESLAKEQKISPVTLECIKRPLLPTTVYKFLGTQGFMLQIKRNKVDPYALAYTKKGKQVSAE